MTLFTIVQLAWMLIPPPLLEEFPAIKLLEIIAFRFAESPFPKAELTAPLIILNPSSLWGSPEVATTRLVFSPSSTVRNRWISLCQAT
jgi:hypothetical protein